MTDMLDANRSPLQTATDEATTAPTIPTQRVQPAPAPADAPDAAEHGAPVVPTQSAPARRDRSRTAPAPIVPTQRVAAPAVLTPPTAPLESPTAPAPQTVAAPARTRRPVRRLALVTASVAALVGALGGGLVVNAQADARAAELARAQGRVAATLDGAQQDEVFQGATQERAVLAATSTVHDAAYTRASAVLAQAAAVLAATPQAGDAPRAQLQASIDSVSAAVTADQVNPAAIDTLAAGLAAPQKAATEAQAAWQAAEDARIAAEKAAAEKAAAEAAAAAARRSTAPRTSRAAAPSAGAAGAAAAPAAVGIPAGGLVCRGAGGSGSESSVGAIGEAINSYRASQGLPTLSVNRSGNLVQHAITMSTAGGIWHSGGDNIVGCSNGGLSSLMSGWKNSPGHNAQMLRTDVSTMYVGGATGAGFLFGAVLFK